MAVGPRKRSSSHLAAGRPSVESKSHSLSIDKVDRLNWARKSLQNPHYMEPYVRLATAAIQGQDLKAVLDEIPALPLEKHYVWRVVSALKWAFTDYDSLGIAADSETLSPEDRIKVTDFLEFRPVQCCLFLRVAPGR